LVPSCLGVNDLAYSSADQGIITVMCELGNI
jgi:hypothetical protein